MLVLDADIPGKSVVLAMLITLTLLSLGTAMVSGLLVGLVVRHRAVKSPFLFAAAFVVWIGIVSAGAGTVYYAYHTYHWFGDWVAFEFVLWGWASAFSFSIPFNTASKRPV